MVGLLSHSRSALLNKLDKLKIKAQNSARCVSDDGKWLSRTKVAQKPQTFLKRAQRLKSESFASMHSILNQMTRTGPRARKEKEN